MKLLSAIFLMVLCSNLQAKEHTYDPYFHEKYPEVQKYLGGLPLQYKQVLDDIRNCDLTPQGCTEEQIQARNDIFGNRIYQTPRHEAYSDIINKKDDDLKFDPYFIPVDTDINLAGLGTTAAIWFMSFTQDQNVHDLVQKNKTDITQEIADAANEVGGLSGMISAGSIIWGYATKNQKLKRMGMFIVVANTITGNVTDVIKDTFQRERPSTSPDDPYNFRAGEGNRSFVSGHATKAFTLLTVISETYKDDHPWVPYVAYSVGALSAYARLHDEKHWLSDTIGAALISTALTRFIMSFYKESNSGLLITPMYNRIDNSFSFHVNWIPNYSDELKLKCGKIKDEKTRIKVCMQELFHKAYND